MADADYSGKAVQSVLHGKMAYCKFLAANDTGETGGHQSGIYVSKPAVPIIFNTPGEKGHNKDRWVKVRWQDDFVTDARFIYYGKGTRNEYRITHFGKGFPFLRPENTGALFVFVQDDEESYQGYFLFTEDEINEFLDAFGLSPVETNRLIEVNTNPVSPEQMEKEAIRSFIESLTVDFPSSEIMSATARRIQDDVYDHQELICSDPDSKLIDWTDLEYRLFRAIEYERYGEIITKGFPSVEDFITTANIVLNRRKSRAGKSLEHHLAAIFDGNQLQYESQAVTEEKKKPDFLFPSGEAYHDLTFSSDRIITLAAKTTCKDRWRQILNEADRRRGKAKYLCTLQQGISADQLKEMETEGVVLVVPKEYIRTYPKEYKDKIWTLHHFIGFVKETERIL